MSRRRPVLYDENRIKNLEKQLEELREELIEVAPRKYFESLSWHAVWSIHNRDTFYEWYRKLVSDVIKAAGEKHKQEHDDRICTYSGCRVFCPLCGRGTESFTGTQGFILPGGLEMHLHGSRVKKRCIVMQLAEERAKERLKEQRRFRIEYYGAPVLINEALPSRCHGDVRNDDQLKWAENRLKEMGFRIEDDEETNTKCYILQNLYGHVLADPRCIGEIVFYMYQKPLKDDKPVVTFHLSDRLCKDLKAQFKKAMMAARREGKYDPSKSVYPETEPGEVWPKTQPKKVAEREPSHQRPAKPIKREEEKQREDETPAEKLLRHRLKIEPLYLIALGSRPVLQDGLLEANERPRDKEGLAWAEQRLRGIGFKVGVNGRIRRYFWDSEELYVLADLRGTGKINFVIYNKPLPKNEKPPILKTFSLSDDYEQSLKGWLEDQLH